MKKEFLIIFWTLALAYLFRHSPLFRVFLSHMGHALVKGVSAFVGALH